MELEKEICHLNLFMHLSYSQTFKLITEGYTLYALLLSSHQSPSVTFKVQVVIHRWIIKLVYWVTTNIFYVNKIELEVSDLSTGGNIKL